MKTYKIISSHKDTKHTTLFVITYIEEKEYKALEAGKDLDIIRGNYRFIINPDDVLCYGDIDFHEGSNDCEVLDTFTFLDHLYVRGAAVPSRYNYDNHECVSPIKRFLYTETFKNSVLCRYYHGTLGKPKYTLIFREIV